MCTANDTTPCQCDSSAYGGPQDPFILPERIRKHMGIGERAGVRVHYLDESRILLEASPSEASAKREEP